jgi:hypothetical protein
MQPKCESSIKRCSKSGDRLQENSTSQWSKTVHHLTVFLPAMKEAKNSHSCGIGEMSYHDFHNYDVQFGGFLEPHWQVFPSFGGI